MTNLKFWALFDCLLAVPNISEIFRLLGPNNQLLELPQLILVA